jgi:predicted HicB family RNase H-like nuclease
VWDFRGEILGLNGSTEFYGRSQKELRAEPRKSLKTLPSGLRKEQHQSTPAFSGIFNLRTLPELHQHLAIQDQTQDCSINMGVPEYWQKGMAIG